MNVVLTINGQDISPVLSKFRVTHEPEWSAEVKTINQKIHKFGKKFRTNIYFSVFPVADTDMEDSRVLLADTLTVKFTDKDRGVIREMEFEMDSNLTSDYGMQSVTGDNYYKRGQIHLVALEVDDAHNIRPV